MKTTLFAFCLLFLVLQTQATMWSDWHNNFHPAWDPNHNCSTFTKPTPPSNWVRNSLTNPQTFFSNFTARRNQYLWIDQNNPANLIFCQPKTYLDSSATYCIRDTFYWNTSDLYINTKCVPQTYLEEEQVFCDGSDPNYPCCFYDSNYQYYQDIYNFQGTDSYSTPLDLIACS